MTATTAVLIPARDERGAIEACLRAVLDQDVGPESLEVIVVDGGSTDGTGDVAQRVLEGAGVARWEVVHNAVGTTPSNLNAGLAEVRSDVVCRVDARSIVPPDYVRRVGAILRGDEAIVVAGGSQVATPRSRGAVDLGIARALNNRWGMGLARYRRDAASGPADTVYLGAFRTADLRDAGGWDEAWTTNQDFELNRRMGRRGTVWFESGLPVGYLPRQAVGAVFWQYHRFGRWKARYWSSTGERPRPRQLVLLALPGVAALGAVGLLRAPRSLRRTVLVLGSAGAVAFEVAGSAEPDGGPAVHVVSLATSAAVGAGWLSGVVRGAVADRSRTAGA